MMIRSVWFIIFVAFTSFVQAEEPRPVGNDVVQAFARAARGEPLRYVAIGGSITQASGPGWVGDWLHEQFPTSAVQITNSGMSATGSALGIFRAERDIISHQPDLVAIEFCVNDGGLSDEDAIRYMETLVVRLKSLPNPPAIVILEAASRNGVKLFRHRQIAKHYGLLEVDWQAAVNAHLAKNKTDWLSLFSDEVHPNKAGHEFYAEVFEQALAPLVERARKAPVENDLRPPLPAVLSSQPLLLDAGMVPLQGIVASGWKAEPSLPFWWNRFFQGVLSADQPGTVLRVPFRGTAVGLFFALHEDYGSFYMSVDGALPSHVFANKRRGYTIALADMNLAAREHDLTVVLPPVSTTKSTLEDNGPIKLGYLLTAGASKAGREASPAGPFGPERLAQLSFSSVPAARWQWTGPFAVPAGEGGAAPVDAQSAIGLPFPPDPGSPEAKSVAWKDVAAEGDKLDFRALSGQGSPAIVYARTELMSEKGGEAILSLDVDYFAEVWLNGESILKLDAAHRVPLLLPVKLKAGSNPLVVKLGAGSAGFSLLLSVGSLAPKP